MRMSALRSGGYHSFWTTNSTNYMFRYLLLIVFSQYCAATSQKGRACHIVKPSSTEQNPENTIGDTYHSLCHNLFEKWIHYYINIPSFKPINALFFIPATAANDLRLRRVSIPDLIHYIHITSLIWRGPWLRIEPETSRTRASTLPLGYRGG